MWQWLAQLLFPNCCLHCQRFGDLLCFNCRQALEWYPLPNIAHRHLCGPNIKQVHIACVYSGPAQSLVHHLKFSGVQQAGSLIAWLMFLSLNFDQYDAITWVPIHQDKLKVRGFNQTQIIAKQLAEKLNLPTLPMLKKVVAGTSQVEKQAKQARLEARENLLFAFNQQIVPPLPRSVLVIDDVVTTGTTLHACAQVLAAAGVENIEAAVFAHSI